jgi:DNA-binding response OmpR family regulator
MSYTILLVDGDAARRERLAQQLALFGDPMLLQAGSGKEALAQSSDRPLDAMLVEAELPDMGGEDLCWLMRRRKLGAPMLVLGDASDTKLVLALESGADDYIGRPFGLSVLLSRLRLHLRRHRSSGDEALRLEPVIYFANPRNGTFGLPRPANQLDGQRASFPKPQ